MTSVCPLPSSLFLGAPATLALHVEKWVPFLETLEFCFLRKNWSVPPFVFCLSPLRLISTGGKEMIVKEVNCVVWAFSFTLLFWSIQAVCFRQEFKVLHMCQTYSGCNCNTVWSHSQYYLLILAPVLSPASEECNFSADIFIGTWEIFRFWVFIARTQKKENVGLAMESMTKVQAICEFVGGFWSGNCAFWANSSLHKL